MNEREIRDVTRRLLAHFETGGTDMGEHPHRLDLSVYTDPEVFAREKELLFRRHPLVVGLSADLPTPGSFAVLEDLETPILLTRDGDGTFRAFENTCRHRGAPVASGCGQALHLSCPFHGWTYDLAGRLVAVPHERTVGALEREALSLPPLPALEHHGLLYVRPSPGDPIDASALLGGLDEQLGGWRLERCAPVETALVPARANWKLAMDTFAEGYHFGPLHAKTVGTTTMTNVMVYDRYGRNHRVAFPGKAMVELADEPESERDGWAHTAFIHFLFPNVTLFVSRDWVYLFRLYPGDRVDRHATRFSVYSREPLHSERAREQARDLFRFVLYTFEKEDYWVSARIQEGLGRGQRTHAIFGRNELSLTAMHRAYREAIGRDPAEVLTPL